MLALLLLLATPQPGPVCDAVWHDSVRNRDVPVRIRMPGGTGKAPVILFSHGLGGTVQAGTVWGEAWAEAGFVVIHLQHPGSDGPAVRAVGFRGAMGAEQLIARGAALADTRIDAAIAFSPSPPTQPGVSDAAAFGAISIPFFSITGTLDEVPALTAVTPADRQRPFAAMPTGGKYLLVMDGANHAAFGGQHYAYRGPAPDSHVEPIIIRLTTLFWRWTLGGDLAARAELDRGAATIGPKDRFEVR